ncbi:iron-sulfur cluster-binding protein [Jeotgalibacillus soli]|uniref:Glycolate oxidase iron-sulfur subunit n=1 Tax=Jeotgalibacillus soli TaxID=889306 RepID=A0A0C2R6D0_9BACL|nr:iron-sulfur cluster-binding protein [Jeotgalibacillus soli]
MKLAAEGKISLDEISDSLDLCLGCRACETACPTNVQYGKILESFKVAKSESNQSPFIEKLALQNALPNKFWQKAAVRTLGIYQKTKLNKLARKSGLLRVLPERLRAFEEITPVVQPPKRKVRQNTILPKKAKLNVAFFTGCVMDVFFAKINDLSIRLLEHAGCHVTIIKEQTCCGALQHHSGDKSFTKKLAKENITAFEQAEYDYVVNSIGGCGAMLVEYDKLLENEPQWVERAEKFAKKNIDISVILSSLGISFEKEINKVVTYQPSCHLLNVQKVKDDPVKLITSIPGLTYLPLPQADMCCGSAGIYNIVHYEESMDILDEKMKHVHTVRPAVIVTSNPGCHLQMCLGVKREGLEKKIRVVHIVELLAEACGIEAV